MFLMIDGIRVDDIINTEFVQKYFQLDIGLFLSLSSMG